MFARHASEMGANSGPRAQRERSRTILPIFREFEHRDRNLTTLSNLKLIARRTPKLPESRSASRPDDSDRFNVETREFCNHPIRRMLVPMEYDANSVLAAAAEEVS